jgi:hypothetical protein
MAGVVEENAFHGAAVRAGPNAAGIGSVTDQKPQRAKDNGLARAGLACHGRHAGRPRQIQRIDQCVIANIERFQHVGFSPRCCRT